MPKLEGSCACGAVAFAVRSHTPTPYMRCYCAICRKSAGSGGFAINIMADAETLEVSGEDHLGVWHAMVDRGEGPEESPARRHFCTRCGSALWLADPRWPDRVYPFAGAIDTPLPAPPETVHVMLDSKAAWVDVPAGPADAHFPAYPELSIEDWHRAHDLWRES